MYVVRTLREGGKSFWSPPSFTAVINVHAYRCASTSKKNKFHIFTAVGGCRLNTAVFTSAIITLQRIHFGRGGSKTAALLRRVFDGAVIVWAPCSEPSNRAAHKCTARQSRSIYRSVCPTMADSERRKKGCWLTVSHSSSRTESKCQKSLEAMMCEESCKLPELHGNVSRSLFFESTTKMNVTRSPSSPPVLQDHANISVPPSKEDFVMTGNLHKRRGGFGKMSQNKWKNRCFVLLRTGNLCYFQVRRNLRRSIGLALFLPASVGWSIVDRLSLLSTGVAWPSSALAAPSFLWLCDPSILPFMR